MYDAGLHESVTVQSAEMTSIYYYSALDILGVGIRASSIVMVAHPIRVALRAVQTPQRHLKPFHTAATGLARLIQFCRRCQQGFK